MLKIWLRLAGRGSEDRELWAAAITAAGELRDFLGRQHESGGAEGGGRGKVHGVVAALRRRALVLALRRILDDYGEGALQSSEGRGSDGGEDSH